MANSAIELLQGEDAPAYTTVETETSTSYTLILADAKKYKRMNNASAITVTVPPNSSVAFPVNTEIEFEQMGAGVVTFSPGSGVTINSFDGLLTNGQYWVCTIKKVATDEWTLIGGVS